jgi:hypothetical protein
METDLGGLPHPRPRKKSTFWLNWQQMTLIQLLQSWLKQPTYPLEALTQYCMRDWAFGNWLLDGFRISCLQNRSSAEFSARVTSCDCTVVVLAAAGDSQML